VFGLAFALASTLFADEARRRAIGWTMASISVAPVAGIPVLTLAGGEWGWRPAVGAAGVLAAIATWMTIVALPGDRRHPETRLRLRGLLEEYAPIRADPATKRLLAVTVLRAVWMLGLITYIGAYLRDDLGQSTERVGLYYMLGGIGTTLGSLAGGSRIGSIAPRATIIAANLAGGVLVLLVLVSSAPVVMVLLPLLAGVGVLASVALTALLAVESPAKPGTTMVLNTSLLNLGAAVGAAVGGALLATGGYTALAIGLPIFAVAAALTVGWPNSSSPRL
jgi:predicted MFS family arabinose efflux permease